MIINFNPLPASACYGNQDQGVIIAAVGESMWNNRAACGRRYTIRCTGPTNQGIPQPCTGSSVTVSVVDRCAGCGANQFDLSQQAFSRIANTDAGRIRIDYARNCKHYLHSFPILSFLSLKFSDREVSPIKIKDDSYQRKAVTNILKYKTDERVTRYETLLKESHIKKNSSMGTYYQDPIDLEVDAAKMVGKKPVTCDTLIKFIQLQGPLRIPKDKKSKFYM
ncbi:hypothetical protein RJ639_008973 [Escallonia herrerae]|uniref:Expansin-like EG45 domain-containing protein n=1 Tax=Escallonia herrerae TaxID=1293975 RepID=A0AA88VUK3_9ASTE|nr:hypothetical protein RJ639_008973 [Escallonia herrerae]